MFITLLSVFIPTIVAVSLPPPTGPYNVGYIQQIFNHSTQNDPVASKNISYPFLLATIYYPTLTNPIIGLNIAPYLDGTTAALAEETFGFPHNFLSNLTSWNIYNASPLDRAKVDASLKPTVVLSPGASENAIKYNVLCSELASHGYTVLALDHPGEAPYLHLPNTPNGIYGLETSAWTMDLLQKVHYMRVSDNLAMITDLYPTFVEKSNLPFNTTHFLTLGHSLGGSVAAGTLARLPSILAGINLDGLYIETPDVKKPFLMIAGTEHTPAIDPSWAPFSKNQSGWYGWLNVSGSDHRDFYDVKDWVDLGGLRGKTKMPALGEIWGPRMDYVLRKLLVSFFEWVLENRKGCLCGKEWSLETIEEFPEVVYINGSQGRV